MVAVKVLRPGVERFRATSFFFAARLAEKFSPRPAGFGWSRVGHARAHGCVEMDLRLEAADVGDGGKQQEDPDFRRRASIGT